MHWIWIALSLLFVLPGCATSDLPPEEQRASIAWSEWEPAAFAKAKAEGKLILVSVHAGWCHWCHVMDERTFADPQVARLVSERFVAIHADADARPDVGERYARWGWPATALLTPDARPILERRGYIPPRRFVALLREVVARQDAAEPLERADVAEPQPVGDLDAVAAAVREQLDGRYDEEQHGWGKGKQKYPWGAAVEQALVRGARGESLWRERGLSSLARYLALVDPAWGGIYQYSDDGTWTSPHYEKIVSVQAEVLSNCALAYRLTGDATWLAGARLVHRFLIQFLRVEGSPTFAASMDAEPPLAALDAGLDGDSYFALDDAGRRRFGTPRIDPAVYADLNGRLIAALAALHRATGEAAYLRQARAALEAIVESHSEEVRLDARLPGVEHHPVHWRFRHTAAGDGRFHLADQVHMGRALLAVYGSSGEPRFLFGARAVARALVIELADLEGGGFFAHTEDPTAVGVFAERRKPFVANALAARFLIQLSTLTGEEGWREVATQTLRALGDRRRIKQQGRILGEVLLALEEHARPPLVLTVAGTAEDSQTEAFLGRARRFGWPNALIKRVDPGEQFPDLGRPALYLCGDNRCSAPITDPAELERAAATFLGLGDE